MGNLNCCRCPVTKCEFVTDLKAATFLSNQRLGLCQAGSVVIAGCGSYMPVGFVALRPAWMAGLWAAPDYYLSLPYGDIYFPGLGP